MCEDCLQCYDTSGRASGLYKSSDEVLVWLSVCSEVQIVCMWSSWCRCHPKPHHLLPHLNPDWFTFLVLFCSLAVLHPRVGHTKDVLSPFIPVLCHSDWLFHRESCPHLDVVHPGQAWPSSPSCTWHCSLHYLFLQATPLFPHCVTIVC